MAECSKTYFISDTHLGATYLDRQAERERVLADFLLKISADAKHIYLVGDILDYWFEYRKVVPRGYVRLFGALATIADAGVKITWLTGNHDIWLFDYLRDEIGIEVVDGSITREIDGRRFFISHGDGLGNIAPSFKLLRAVFRNRTCQRLYAMINPRWTVGFAHKWSSSNRDYDPNDIPVYEGRIQNMVETWAEEYLASHPDTDFIVLGHHHVMVDKTLPSTTTKLVILGDWIYNYSYAEFDGSKLQLKQFATAYNEFNNSSH